ncbi:MAG: Response regulator receiver protein [Fibrobacteres bacterium]|nr:Response regulator receiver protein [Fibrobacterota bacterium]
MTASDPGILLIEDDYDDATQMARILKKYRIANHVETVADGQEALRLLGSGFAARAELILLDYSLPGMTSMEAAIRMRSLPGLDMVPIILCCGSPEEEHQVKQWAMKRVATMSKPAGFFKLLECIQKLEMHWQVFGSKPA